MLKVNIENIDFDIKVSGKTVEIIPKDGIKYDSEYTIDIISAGNVTHNSDFESKTIDVFTPCTSAYSTIDDVKSLISSFCSDDEFILRNIISSSKYADYVKGTSYKDSTPPFDVSQFVRFDAAKCSLLKGYTEKACNEGTRGQVADLMYENTNRLIDFKYLLTDLTTERDYWLGVIEGKISTEIANPEFTVKGIRPDPIIYFDDAPAVAPINSSFDRGV